MSDLISRRAVINILQELADMETCGNHVSDIGFGLSMAIGRLISAPAVDAVPVVHAGWKDQDYTFTRFQCAACKSMNHSIMTKYCPDCGARMDGKVYGSLD